VRQLLPGGLETSEGADATALASLAGLTLDDWQSWFLGHSLRKLPSGQWSAFEVGLIVPRQNGKGALLEARQLAGLFITKEPLQVHSAHEFKTAFEHFLRIVNLVEGCPDLDRRVMRVRRGAGEQAIELKNGCRLRFLCRSTGSGRGLTGDTIYLDEAFALTQPMMGALLPTLSAVPNPQVWYTSSAPRMTSDVLHSLRQRGVDGSTPRLLFAEWGLEQDADPDDPQNWYLANPAMGARITEEFVRAELEAMRSMPAEFGRERLGIAETPADEVPLIPNWDALLDPGSIITSNRSIALDVTPDRRFAALAWAGRRADGMLHVEAFDHRPGTAWVLEAAKALSVKWRLPIRVQANSPAAALIAPMVEAGVQVVEVTAGDHAKGLGQLLDAAAAKQVWHIGAQPLTTAVKGAEVRTVGDADVLARRTSKVDISPLVAVVLAVGGVPELTVDVTANVW
jgi:hypothetical protein